MSKRTTERETSPPKRSNSQEDQLTEDEWFDMTFEQRKLHIESCEESKRKYLHGYDYFLELPKGYEAVHLIKLVTRSINKELFVKKEENGKLIFTAEPYTFDMVLKDHFTLFNTIWYATSGAKGMTAILKHSVLEMGKYKEEDIIKRLFKLTGAESDSEEEE